MKNIKLLILDDDYDVRLNLQIYFEDEDIDCSAYEDSVTALNEFSNTDFEVGIVDLRLPVMNGEEFILEAHKINPRTKFLIYTGSSDYKLSKELIDIGMTQNDVYHKPIKSMDIFVKKIKELSSGL